MSNPKQSPPGDRAKRLTTAVLLLIVVAAGVVRFYRIGAEDYWLDELHTLADSAARRGELEALPHGVLLRDVPRFTDLTQHSTLSAVWRGMVEDAHPPLYFTLVNLWRRWFGDTEAAVRALSALCSLLTLIPVALLFRQASWRRFGTPALVLMAFSYADLFMAQQARPYTLAILLICWASFLLVTMEARWEHVTRLMQVALALAYGLTLFGALLTHYFAALPLLAHVVYALTRFRRRLLVSWLMSCLTAATCWLLIWGPAFLAQRAMIAHQPWLLEPRPDHLIRTLKRVADLPMRLLFDYPPFSFSTARSIAGAGLILVIAWLIRSSNRRGQRTGLTLLFVMSYALPTLILLGIDLFTDRQMLAHLRYCYFALPGLIGLGVLAFDGLSHRRRLVAAITFAAGTMLTLRLPTQHTPDARLAAAIIEQTAEPDDVLIYEAVTWPEHWASRMYAEISYYLQHTDRPFVMLRKPPEAQLLDDLRTFNRIVVVSPRPDVIPNPLPGEYELAQEPSGYIDQIGWVYVFGRGG